MDLFRRKIFFIALTLFVVLGIAAGIGYKQKYHLKKFVKNNPFLYEQAVKIARMKSQVLGGTGGGNYFEREIDTRKATWNLVFDASQSLGTYERFWGNLGSESFKTGILSGRSLRLFEFIKKSNARVGDGSFERNAFRHFRAHNLYSNGEPPWGEGLEIYQVDNNGKVHYDWTLTDEVFDAMLRVGFKPFHEFGFMPDALASIPDRRQKWGRGNISPPKDYREWQKLVYNTVRHFVERYGEEEVASWYFEVWNESDLGWLFWVEDPDPGRNPYGDLKEYHKLYDYTLAAAKSAFPQIVIGGPASAGADINFLLEHIFVEKKGKYGNYTPIDFVSSHGYGPIGYDYRMHPKKSLVSSINWKLGNSVEHDHSAVRKSMETLPFILSETGAKYKKRIIHHGRYVAAWYAKMVDSMFYLGDNLGKVYQPREVIYWSAHQVVKNFEHEKGGIAGALKKDGHSAVFKLPVYNTMEALGYLSNERIPLVHGSQFGETVHAIATKNSNESVEVLLYHLEEEIDERAGSGGNYIDSLKVRVVIENLPFEQFKLAHYTIDETHSNTYATWLKLGKPKKIGNRESQVLSRNQDLALFEPVRILQADSGRKFKLDIAMQAQSVHLLRLIRN